MIDLNISLEVAESQDKLPIEFCRKIETPNWEGDIELFADLDGNHLNVKLDDQTDDDSDWYLSNITEYGKRMVNIIVWPKLRIKNERPHLEFYYKIFRNADNVECKHLIQTLPALAKKINKEFDRLDRQMIKYIYSKWNISTEKLELNYLSF